MAISDACPAAPPDGSVMGTATFNRRQSGDWEGSLTMYHDACVGKAMPFPLFAYANDRMR
jgi:hypothetical protein